MTKQHHQQQQQQQQQQQKDEGTKPKYDSRFTDSVIAATGPNANPRLAQIMPSLVKHLHDFAREVDLTVEEWMAGVEMVSCVSIYFPCLESNQCVTCSCINHLYMYVYPACYEGCT